MTRQIILHIGSPKCGSTYLQQVMLQNQDILNVSGINYPHLGFGHPGNAADLADITPELVEAMFAGDVQKAVLSHEDLYGLPKRGDALSQIAAETGIKVQLVAFLRPFSEFVFGDYSQFMKQHFETYLANRNPYDGQDFNVFATRRVKTLLPAKFLRNWQQRFPQTPLIVAGHYRIQEVFETLLPEVQDLNWIIEHSHANPSLRVEDCERIAAAMNDTSIPDQEIREMFAQAYHNTGLADAGRAAERSAWIEAQFASQNAALLAHFGFDNHLPDDCKQGTKD